MAIITISRKVASLGDETALALAKKLNYTFVTRHIVEKALKDRGIPEDILKKYDEKKPTFWASLSRERDRYVDILREVILELALNDNSIFIGRGGFSILKDIPGCYSVRLVSSDKVRLNRLMEEFNWTEQQARERLVESDQNRDGFHKCFFNVEIENPAIYDLVITTDNITCEQAAEIIKTGLEQTLINCDTTKIKEAVRFKLLGQKIVNEIAFEQKLSIYFLDAEVSENEIVLHGISESAETTEKAIEIAKKLSEKQSITCNIKFVSSYKPGIKDIHF